MTNSLRDQLMNLGFKAPAAEPKRKPQGDASKRPARAAEAGRKDRPARPAGKSGPARKPRPEMDLGKAYALRAQQEKDERIAAEKAKQEAARKRREARARLGEFLQGKILNQKDAEIARHFEYGGKIKRIYVTAEQLKALNAGELGVVQLDGRYLLVGADTLNEAEKIFPDGVALRVDPNATAESDPYSDPKYQVPDDLVW
ncbi:DUF2058 domain-containing protein [Pseudomarimonas arenosa]|uniref:DUF2058 family protein n=1 Tax=Pseudomarimonas arenosa TaxID=2774145 RepID=A0AAW3ZEK7_9GAMM|nr:DUF2058 family protein [Pseudomarimonas arenosa]MBD8524551.1 DUF2058 family protein [Pseudomarimonas arenosa]